MLLQELACLQGVGSFEWSHYRMGEASDGLMQSFIGNSQGSQWAESESNQKFSSWQKKPSACYRLGSQFPFTLQL